MMAFRKKIGILLGTLSLIVFAGEAAALTCTSTQDGDWKDQIWTPNACNANGGPPAGSTVIIANGTKVKVDKNTFIVGNITIEAGGTLRGNGGDTLSFSGNLTNNGTFTANSGTVKLTGTNQTITGNMTFANLTVNAGTQLTLVGNITITGTTNLAASHIVSTCPTNYTVTNQAGAVLHNTCVAQSCTLPWGGTIASGSSTLAYQTASVAFGASCVSETRTCTAGVLSGTYQNQSCTAPTVCPTLSTGTVVNTYYPGAATAAAGSGVITLGTPTAGTAIAVNDLVLIMQMQDAAVDSTNTASYGNPTLNSSGMYEYAQVQSITGSTLTLKSPLANTYTNAAATTTAGQRTFQVVRVPVYADGALPATGLTAQAWNGSTGGILALDVMGTLNLNNAVVDVSGKGFRGGAARTLAGGAGTNTDYRTSAAINNNGSKGEGIAGTPQYMMVNDMLVNTTIEGYPNGSHARGAPANAGGGGTDGNPAANDQNTGGGGGANAGAGGLGGIGWCGAFNATMLPNYNCSNSGGLGGYAVTGLGASRLTMGGGGGAATTNNGTGTPPAGLAGSGAAGGGIIMLRAGAFTGAATFNANGSAANNTVANDGSGGGGAGGAVILLANSGLSGATINVNGGNGGTNLIPPLSSGPHGPGGGGGGGYVLTSGAVAACNAAGGANGVTYQNGTIFGAYGATAGAAGSCSSGLTSTQIQGSRLGVGPCVASGPAQFGITVGGSASTCQPQEVTITAQDAAGATLTSYTGTINISTSSGNGDWQHTAPTAQANGTLTQGAADSGAASYSFVAADAGVIKLALADQHAENLTISVVDSVASSSASTSGTVVFGDNAFVITNDTIQVAGKPQAMTVAMWRKDATSGTCSIASNYVGAKGLKAWLTLDANDPGGTGPTISTVSLPTSSPFLDNLSLTFTAGSSNFSLDTSDVGKYVLNLLDDSGTFAGVPATPIHINGSSSTITTRPFALVVNGIKQGTNNNPAGSGAAGAKFAKAGTSFEATVGAYLWNTAADTDANGLPDTAATLAQITANGLTPSYKWPVTLAAGAPYTPSTASDTPPGTGAAGAFNNGALAATDFTGGAATSTTLNYTEVGSFTLSGLATNFLNTTGVNLNALVFDSNSSRNAVVGRFYPAAFTVSNGSIINRSDIAACIAPAGCDGFTYMGEQMGAAFTLTAKAANGATTKNYQGAYAKLTLNTASMVLGAIDKAAVRVPLTTRLDTTIGAAASAGFSAGVANITVPFAITRGANADGPFDALNLGIAPVDSDGVSTIYDLDTTNVIATTNNKTLVGATIARFGRLKINNAYGSELLPLTLMANAEYFSAGRWLPSITDTVTSLVIAANYNIVKAGTVQGTTAPTVTGAVNLAAGALPIVLGAPGVGKTGAASITPGVPAYLSLTPGTATFGVYKGNREFIYQREAY